MAIPIAPLPVLDKYALVRVFTNELLHHWGTVFTHRTSMPQLAASANALPHNEAYSEGSGLLFGMGNINAASDIGYSQHSTSSLLLALLRFFPQIMTCVFQTGSFHPRKVESVLRERTTTYLSSFLGNNSSSANTARACLEHLSAIIYCQRTRYFWNDLTVLHDMLTREKLPAREKVTLRDDIINTVGNFDAQQQPLHVANPAGGPPLLLAAGTMDFCSKCTCRHERENMHRPYQCNHSVCALCDAGNRCRLCDAPNLPSSAGTETAYSQIQPALQQERIDEIMRTMNADKAWDRDWNTSGAFDAIHSGFRAVANKISQGKMHIENKIHEALIKAVKKAGKKVIENHRRSEYAKLHY